jgi:hypothetical protein
VKRPGIWRCHSDFFVTAFSKEDYALPLASNEHGFTAASDALNARRFEIVNESDHPIAATGLPTALARFPESDDSTRAGTSRTRLGSMPTPQRKLGQVRVAWSPRDQPRMLEGDEVAGGRRADPVDPRNRKPKTISRRLYQERAFPSPSAGFRCWSGRLASTGFRSTGFTCLIPSPSRSA